MEALIGISIILEVILIIYLVRIIKPISKYGNLKPKKNIFNFILVWFLSQLIGVIIGLLLYEGDPVEEEQFVVFMISFMSALIGYLIFVSRLIRITDIPFKTSSGGILLTFIGFTAIIFVAVSLHTEGMYIDEDWYGFLVSLLAASAGVVIFYKIDENIYLDSDDIPANKATNKQGIDVSNVISSDNKPEENAEVSGADIIIKWKGGFLFVDPQVSIYIDDNLERTGSFTKGFNFIIKATPGSHILKLFCAGRTQQLPIEIEVRYQYVINLKYSRAWGKFNNLEVEKSLVT